MDSKQQQSNNEIKSWSSDISLLPPVSHKLMKEYLVGGITDLDKRPRGADKHKVM